MHTIRFGDGASSRRSISGKHRAQPTIVVFGVSGCGKSTVGRLLAAARGALFLEGDLYHSPGAIAKMSAGTALSDVDRRPWLDRIARALRIRRREGRAVVIACSALKRSYRKRLADRAGGDVVFVHLAPDQSRLQRRLDLRRRHFMSAALLDSQLATLEPLAPDEAGTTLTGDRPTFRAVADIQRWLVDQKAQRRRK